MQLKDIAPLNSTVPSDLTTTPISDLRSDIPPVESNHPDVQELIARVQDNQEMDCLSLDRGDKDFIGAIYMEVVHNPDFHPTPEILELIRTANARMRLGTKRAVA